MKKNKNIFITSRNFGNSNEMSKLQHAKYLELEIKVNTMHQEKK